MDTDSTNVIVSDHELALLRELEACEVRLRLLNTAEGHARAGSLLREFQMRRDAAETRLRKFRATGNPATMTSQPAEASAADVSDARPPALAPDPPADHDRAASKQSSTTAKPRRARRKSTAPGTAVHASPQPS